MAEFIHFLSDPIVMGMVVSPMMGVIFACVFSGFTGSVDTQAPVTIVQTRHVYINKTESRGRSATNTDDGMGLMIVFSVIFLYMLKAYAESNYFITQYLQYFILSMLGFSIAIIILSWLKGQYTSGDWWFYTFFPPTVFIISFFIAEMAQNNISNEIQRTASENSIYSFYFKNLTDYGRKFMLMQILGILSLILGLMISFLFMVHYLSLMNLRSTSWMSNVWYFLGKHTLFASKKSSMVFIGVLIFTSLITVDKNMAVQWIT